MRIEEKLKEVIVNIAMQDVDVADINEETNLVKDLGYDSVQIIELIVELETEFDIEIEDDDLDIENMVVYSRLYKTVESKIKNM